MCFGIGVGVTSTAARHQAGRHPVDGWAVLLLAVGAIALLVRRRHPVATMAVAFAATLTYMAVGYVQGPVWGAMVVALITLVWTGHRRWAWATLVVGFAAFTVVPRLTGADHRINWAAITGVAAWLLVLGAGSELLRTRRDRIRDAARVHREEARRKESEERLRIARELHDVVAHNLSLINVQAGTALHLLERRPEQARPALAAIKDASKEALMELRSVLGVLRAVDDEAPRRPTPRLDRLDALVNRSRAAGLEVTVSVRGDRRTLPPPVELAAYRIVQEAVTNVVRHVGPTVVTIGLEYRPDALVVEVLDEGSARVPAGTATVPGRDGAGRGLVGMRERAAALGGEVTTGTRPGGGFGVRAVLPLAAAS